jgi:hypothetical protein
MASAEISYCRILAGALLMLCAHIAAAVTVDIHKDKARPTFRDYAYEVFAFDVGAGSAPSLAIEPAGSYVKLMLRRPDGTFASANFEDGTVREDPVAGRWVAVLTSAYAFAEKTLRLTIDGASNVRRLQSHEIDAQMVESAFAHIGVEMPERARERRRQRLIEQLGLPSFRAELIGKLANSVAPTQDERRQRARLTELENNVRALQRARDDARNLRQPSRDLLDKLIADQIRNTESNSKRLAQDIEEATLERKAYALALAELKKLDALYTGLAAAPEHAQTELQKSIQSLATSLADRLLASRFVRELSFRLDTRSRDDGSNALRLASHASYAQAQDYAHYGSEEYNASSHLEAITSGGVFSFQRNVLGLVGSSLAKTADPVDTSVWLRPLLPWPPPRASSRVVLNDHLIPAWGARFHTLGDVDSELTAALERADYAGPAYFGVPGGFALITQLEQTDESGGALSAHHRWTPHIVDMKAFELTHYLKALLSAPAGYFRVLAFVTTATPFSTSAHKARIDTIEQWASDGANTLPMAVRELPFSPQHQVTVLVYEFLKKDSQAKPETSIPGRHTARRHLEASHVLAALQAAR